VRKRDKAQPGEQESRRAGTDIGLQEEMEVGERTLSAGADVPLWVGEDGA
jgi:hypothetical protein